MAANLHLSTPLTLPSVCVADHAVTCETEAIGPDDRRYVCDGGRWIYYTSGEMWHIENGVVLCHLSPNGETL